MDAQRKERLMKKYSDFSVGRGKKEMTVMRGGRGPMGRAMEKSGKPKNALKTIVKLLKYISDQKVSRTTILILRVYRTGAVGHYRPEEDEYHRRKEEYHRLSILLHKYYRERRKKDDNEYTGVSDAAHKRYRQNEPQ